MRLLEDPIGLEPWQDRRPRPRLQPRPETTLQAVERRERALAERRRLQTEAA